MENISDAAGGASVPQTEQTPTTTPETAPSEPVQPQAPNLHGFTEEQLADMEKFYSSQGGYEKVKSRISNPEKYMKPAEPPHPVENNEQSAPGPQPPQDFSYQPPRGAITPSEFLAAQYFRALSGEEKYANISDGIQNGDYLKEMSAFGIKPLNPDGSINDQKIRMYLDLKSQTVPASPTGSEPDASTAPTVSYTEIGENGITNIDQAYKILLEGGNPNVGAAEKYIREHMNGKK